LGSNLDKNEQAQALNNLIANYSKFTQLPFRITRSNGVVEFPVHDFCARNLPVAG
jgi:hypothetical protein